MRSSSPAESSPSESPFTSSASRRYVSKVYSRRTTLGSSAAKRARKVATPGTDDGSDDDNVEADEPQEEVEVQRKMMSYKDREELRKRDGLLSSPKSKNEMGAMKGLNGTRRKASDARNGSTHQTVPLKLDGRPKRQGSSYSSSASVRDGKRPATYGRRQIAGIGRTDTETSISSAPDVPSPSLAPPITVQPATSSPSVIPSSQAVRVPEPPSTPPRKRIKRNPLTPTSSPRDLSTLFAPVSPGRSPGLRRTVLRDDVEDAGPSKKGGGLLRKMLDKTQSLGGMASPAKSTEEVEDYFGLPRSGSTSFSPLKNIARTYSLPSTPSKTPAKEEESVPHAMSLIVPIASSSRLEPAAWGSGGRGTRTYGRQRTMLAETSNDSPRSGVSSLGEKEVVKESYAELRKQFEVDNTGGDDMGQGSFMMDLLAVRGGQSVSDLRSKGENRRFMDELGYMVDPVLDPTTSIGLKRSSIHDILRSMQEGEWLHRTKICGQVERIWQAMYDAIGEKGDELIEAMCLLYLVNLVKSGSGLELVLPSHDESCVRVLLASLKVTDGPLDATSRSKMTGLFVKIRNMFQKVELGWTSSTTSTRRLASFLLVEVTSPALWLSSSEALSADKAMSRISKTLALEVDTLSCRFDLVEKGLDLLPEDRPPDIDHIAQCLTVVYRMISQEIAERQALVSMADSMGSAVINALVSGVHLALNEVERVQRTGVTITIQSVQILAAMATTSPEWAGTIAQVQGGLTALARVLLHRSILGVSPPEAPSTADLDPFLSPRKTTRRTLSPAQGETGEEDLLCAVLAILTTAVTGSDEVRDALAVLRIHPSCKGAKACLRTCTCDDSELFVGLLVQIHMDHANSESPTASVIAAYLAILLAKLLVVPHSRPVILSALPGEDDPSKLSRLIEVLSALGGLENRLHARLRDVAAQSGEEVEQDGEGDEGVVRNAIEDLRGLMADIE